jgi:hypothetical protein
MQMEGIFTSRSEDQQREQPVLQPLKAHFDECLIILAVCSFIV